jgi:hypothetical protein
MTGQGTKPEATDLTDELPLSADSGHIRTTAIKPPNRPEAVIRTHGTPARSAIRPMPNSNADVSGK